MTTPNLAKIERVDLREAWEHEAYNFTPWLAKHIAELGDALKMNLQAIQQEAPVGSFSLDILAVDFDSNRRVIIENQLEVTNHTHLGQLITYAAGYDANVVVWLTREFRDEHRQALDWLNQRTGEDTQFFGVEVELWRIGESLPAPHFKAVATPNDWIKRQKSAVPVTEKDKQNFEWRGVLIESLRNDSEIKFSSRRNVEAKATWLLIERPVTDVIYAATWSRGNPGIEIIAHKGGAGGREWNQRFLDALEAESSSIEAGLVDHEKGEWCLWERDHRQGSSRAVIYRNGNIFEEPELRAEFCDWMIQKLHKFRQVITPRLQEFTEQEQPTSE